MLVLSRKHSEKIIIGRGESAITITVVDIRGDRVRLGFDAPDDVLIDREEIRDAKDRCDRRNQ